MTRVAISASETNVNSPVSQTLMDKIRGNDDNHESRILSLESAEMTTRIIAGYYDQDATAVDYHIDNTRGWKDQYITVKGNAYQNADGMIWRNEQILPGGLDDAVIGSPYTGLTASNNLISVSIDGWFYSRNGSSRGVDPFLSNYYSSGGVVTTFYLGVESTYGNLVLSMTTNGSGGNRNMAWNLIVSYSRYKGHY